MSKYLSPLPIFLSTNSLKNIKSKYFHLIQNDFSYEKLRKIKRKVDTFSLSSDKCDDIYIKNVIGPIYYLKNEQGNTFIYRKIKGDGNCFYRSILFLILEEGILKNDLQFLMEFIISFITIIKSDKYKNIIKQIQTNAKLNIDLNETLNYLLAIYFSLCSKGSDPINKTYKTFIKIYNNCPDFDYGLILYLKLLLHYYIEPRKTNIISKEFNVSLGSLLPDGANDFTRFFRDLLFHFYAEAEKIVIYVCPIVFDRKMEVRYLDNKGVVGLTLGSVSSSFSLNLIYYKSHYEISYSSSFFQKYQKSLDICLFSLKIQLKFEGCSFCQESECRNEKIMNIKDIEIENEDNYYILNALNKNCQNKNEIYIPDVCINICRRCLVKFLRTEIKKLFLKNLNKNKKNFLGNFSDIPYRYKLSDIEKDPNSENNITNVYISLYNIFYFSINSAIISLNQYYPLYNIENLVKFVKKSICSICQKKNNNNENTEKNHNSWILPCDCYVCSQKCAKFFYDIILATVYIKKKFYCICGILYEKKDILKLISIFNEMKINCKNLIDFLFKFKYKYICFMCLEHLKKTSENKIMEIKVENKNFLLNTYDIPHFICKKCYESIYKNKNNINNNNIGDNNENENEYEYEYECKICETNHSFILNEFKEIEIYQNDNNYEIKNNINNINIENNINNNIINNINININHNIINSQNINWNNINIINTNTDKKQYKNINDKTKTIKSLSIAPKSKTLIKNSSVSNITEMTTKKNNQKNDDDICNNIFNNIHDDNLIITKGKKRKLNRAISESTINIKPYIEKIENEKNMEDNIINKSPFSNSTMNIILSKNKNSKKKLTIKYINEL